MYQENLRAHPIKVEDGKETGDQQHPDPPSAVDKNWFPSSPKELFLYSEEDGQSIENGKLGQKEGEVKKPAEEDSDSEQLRAKRKRRRNCFRCLICTQFIMTVFTFLFIIIILILVAIILYYLQDTLERAETAIRQNPVSVAYGKMKSVGSSLKSAAKTAAERLTHPG